ncbi:hypothetical protein EG68_10795 [Paragonimus skrjabini miyazakii]|uniref:Uncharacterized protein n=1 Tax=Paragonimus skrjabini miyazakii TaxID=59628 RepID=A0A8S9YQG8_9TREM|nr:hypothetical protein EG68_10795 [Paragonimus skrjabini miyazakii]
MEQLKNTLTFGHVKRLSFMLMFLFTIKNGVHWMFSKTHPCLSLFHDGYVDSNDKWRPADCMTYEYYPRGVLDCANVTEMSIFFLGDATLYPVFHRAASSLSDPENMQTGSSSNPIHFHRERLHLCFFHQTELNDSAFYMLSHWKHSEDFTVEWISTKFRNSSDNPCFKIHPSTVVIGLGKESSLTERDPTSDREHFITSFKKLAEISGSTNNSVPFIWMLQGERRLLSQYN